jgi:hypothetical protein
MLLRPTPRAHLRVAIAGLALVWLAAPAFADSVTVGLDDITFDAGYGKYIIKHMDVTDANLGAPEIRALISGTGTGTLADRLAKLTAKSIVIPTLDFESTLGGIAQKITYRDGKLTDIANGKIGKFDFGSATQSAQMPGDAQMTAELKGMHGAGIDLVAIARIMTETAKSDNDPLLPIYSESSIDSYVLKLPNLEITIGPSSSKDIKGRALKVPFGDLMSKMPKPAKPGEALAPEEAKKALEFFASIFDVYGAYAVGSMEFGPIKVAVAASPASNGEAVEVTLKHAAIKDYANARLGELSAEGLDISAPKTKVHMGKYTVRDYDFKEALAAVGTIMKFLPELEDKTKPPKPEFLKAIMGMYSTISLGKFEISDVSFDVTDPESGKPVSLAFSRMAMNDFKNARIGEIAFDGLDVKTEQGKVHLGKSALRGFDFKELLTSFGDFMGKMTPGPDGDMTPPAEGMQLKMPKLEEFRIEDVAIDVLSPPAEDNPDAGPVPAKASLALFSLRPDLGPLGVPKNLTMVIDHFKMLLPANDPNMAMAREAGIEEVDLSSKLDAGWDDAKQQLKIGGLSLSGEGLGKIALSGVIDNVPKEAFFGDEFVRQAAMLGAVLKSADIKVENTSLFQKVLAAQAKASGQSEADMKSTLIAGAAVGIPTLLGNSPAARTLANAVAKFLADPKTLHITAGSKEGVGAADIGAPDKILDKVDLQATANE